MMTRQSDLLLNLGRQARRHETGPPRLPELPRRPFLADAHNPFGREKIRDLHTFSLGMRHDRSRSDRGLKLANY